LEYFCTPCCKRKRRDAGLLPACERYLSKRISFVRAESERYGRPLLILSGEYGLLAADAPIPWYDHQLRAREVDQLADAVAAQLAARRATRLVFYARPRGTPGWRPYFEVCEEACRLQRVALAVRLLGPQYL
jgi:hypothetical protein